MPENQRADFAESAIRITGQRLSRLLSDPEFTGPSNNWVDVLPDLCRTINRCPLKSPFAGLSREQLHFGGTNENFCPLALQFREETLDAVEIPCEGEIEKYNPFAEYLKQSQNKLQVLRTEYKDATDARRRSRHDKDRPRSRQLNHEAVPVGALIFVVDKYHKKDRPQTYGAKRKIYRVLLSEHSGITAQSLEAPHEVRTAPVNGIELITRRDFDAAYPRVFYHEIAKLSHDFYRRYHMSTKSLLEQLDRAPEDRHPQAPGKYAGLPPGHPVIPQGEGDTTTTAREIDLAGPMDEIVDDLINDVVDVVDSKYASDKSTSPSRRLRSDTKSTVIQYPK